MLNRCKGYSIDCCSVLRVVCLHLNWWPPMRSWKLTKRTLRYCSSVLTAQSPRSLSTTAQCPAGLLCHTRMIVVCSWHDYLALKVWCLFHWPAFCHLFLDWCTTGYLFVITFTKISISNSDEFPSRSTLFIAIFWLSYVWLFSLWWFVYIYIKLAKYKQAIIVSRHCLRAKSAHLFTNWPISVIQFYRPTKKNCQTWCKIFYRPMKSCIVIGRRIVYKMETSSADEERMTL